MVRNRRPGGIQKARADHIYPMSLLLYIAILFYEIKFIFESFISLSPWSNL